MGPWQGSLCHAVPFARLHFHVSAGLRGGFFLLARLAGSVWALRWLVAASLFFYGWWDPRFVPLLIGSVLANHLIARHHSGHAAAPVRTHVAKRCLTAGIVLDLGRFWHGSNTLISCCISWRRTLPSLGLALPLAISFFTFQQIMFLVEAYRHPEPRHRSAALRRVHHVFPASDRRPHRPAARYHSAIEIIRALARPPTGQYHQPAY